MAKWLPIETAPKDGRWFLACDDHNEFAYRARWDGRDYASEGQIVSLREHHFWNGWAPQQWTVLPDPPFMEPIRAQHEEVFREAASICG